MKYLPAIFIMFASLAPAHAQNLVSTTTTEVFDASQKYNSDFDSVGNPRLGRRNPNGMQKVFKEPVPYIPKYAGQKDRYDVAVLKNDPEVLFSDAKHKSGPVYIAKKEDSVITANDAQDKDVTISSCVEWNGECQQSDEFHATVTEVKNKE